MPHWGAAHGFREKACVGVGYIVLWQLQHDKTGIILTNISILDTH
jgi:hypothetical protein